LFTVIVAQFKTFCLDLLRSGPSGGRNPVGAKFSAPIQYAPGLTKPLMQLVPDHSWG